MHLAGEENEHEHSGLGSVGVRDVDDRDSGLGVGVYRWSLILAGEAELKSFPGDEPHGSPFYRRAVRAHANCVENLPVFVAIVLAEQAAGAHSPTLDVLSAGVVVARIVQTTA